MKYQNLTKEMMDQKILKFQDHIKSDKGSGHNLYYICTVDKDDNICEERYGTNLLSNRGFAVLYTNNLYSARRIRVGTGYMNNDNATRNGTAGPVLHEECMGEYAATCETYVEDRYTVASGYDDMNDTDNGVIYQIEHVAYGNLGYTVMLDEGNKSAHPGHTGGGPDSMDVDDRWKVDPITGDDYFNISEIAIIPSNGSTDNECVSYKSYKLSNGSTSDDYKDKKTWNTFWHFLVLDYDGTFSPIKKKNTQKLIIHIYHSHVLSEAYINDQYDDGQYLLIAPKMANELDKNIYVFPYSCNHCYLAWNNLLGINFEIVDRNATPSAHIPNSPYVHSSMILRPNDQSLSLTGGGLPDVEATYGPTNGSGVSVSKQFIITSRIIEDPYLYISHYVVTNKNVSGSSTNEITSVNNNACDMVLYLYASNATDPDTITCYEVYTNTTETLKFDQAFHVNDTNNNIALYRHGVIPCMHLAGTIPTNGYYFNINTNTFDISKTVTIPDYFYPQDVLAHCLKYEKILCPDDNIHDVIVYLNPFAYLDSTHHGPYPGTIITSFNVTGETIYATNQYWDSTKWVAFEDTTNTGSQTSDGQNLVQMKYFIRYCDNYTSGTSTKLSLTFRDQDCPSITSATDYKELIDYDNDGYYFQLDQAIMVGNDDWFTISRSTVIQLEGNVGKDSANTLALDKMYRPASETLRMDYQMHQATGNNLAYRIDDSSFINITDIINYPTSTIPIYRLEDNYGNSNGSTGSMSYIRSDRETGSITASSKTDVIKTLKHHFATGHNQYEGNDIQFDQDDEQFMIVNEPAFIRDETSYVPTITIFDTTINIDTTASTTITSFVFDKNGDPTDATDTSYDFTYNTSPRNEERTGLISNAKKCVMRDGLFIDVDFGDVIMPIFRIDKGVTYAADLGDHSHNYTSYNTDGYWGGVVYDNDGNTIKDSNNNDIKITRRHKPYVVTNTDIKKIRLFSWYGTQGINANDPTSNTSDNTSKMFDDPIGIYLIKNHNYGLDMPYIENAQYGTCIRASKEYTTKELGVSKSWMVYNDCSEGKEPYQTWNVIDMDDPVDGNGDPNIIQSFDLDPLWIGTGSNVITGTIGFSHYMYIRMKSVDGSYQIIMYDIMTESLQIMGDSQMFDYVWSTHVCQFTATKDIMCFTGMSPNTGNSNEFTPVNSSGNFGSNVYCILEKDPTQIRKLYFSTSPYTSRCFCGVQLKYVNWGTNQDQLLLAVSSSYNGNSYVYNNRTVLDIGKWLHEGGWQINEAISPVGHWNPTQIKKTNIVSPIYIYEKGVIQFENMNPDAHNLEYKPLEYFLPMKLTLTTDTINAYNNPIELSGLGFEIGITNDMKAIHNDLEYNDTNIDHTNTV